MPARRSVPTTSGRFPGPTRNPRGCACARRRQLSGRFGARDDSAQGARPTSLRGRRGRCWRRSGPDAGGISRSACARDQPRLACRRGDRARRTAGDANERVRLRSVLPPRSELDGAGALALVDVLSPEKGAEARQVVRTERGQGVRGRPGEGLARRGFELEDPGAQHVVSCHPSPDARGHGTEILTDDDRTGRGTPPGRPGRGAPRPGRTRRRRRLRRAHRGSCTSVAGP